MLNNNIIAIICIISFLSFLVCVSLLSLIPPPMSHPPKTIKTTKTAFNLDTYDNKADVLKAASNIVYKKATSTDTNEGIKYMREKQMSNGQVRPNVAKVAVVFTDGNSDE